MTKRRPRSRSEELARYARAERSLQKRTERIEGMDKSQTEPAKQQGAQGALVAFVIAAAALAVALGIDVSNEVLTGIIGVIGALFVLAPYLTALRIRERVFSPATAQKIAEGAHHAGQTGQPVPKVTT